MSEDTMTQERPSLTAHARRIAELAGKRAADAEQQRRLSPDVVDAVLRAGFAAHFVPVAHGGRAATFGELVEPVAVLGEACASTAWYASLTASLGRMAAYLPDEGQAELWSDGPDALIVGALMPLGRAEKTPGGWHVSGTWPFVSVVDHSDWALICAKVGEEPWFFAVPRQEYGIVDSWYPMGMRGTGSNTLVLDGVFVPDARACTRAAIAAGLGPDAEAICHTVPMRAVNGLAFALPMLGAARGAAAVWTSAPSPGCWTRSASSRTCTGPTRSCWAGTCVTPWRSSRSWSPTTVGSCPPASPREFEDGSRPGNAPGRHGPGAGRGGARHRP